MNISPINNQKNSFKAQLKYNQVLEEGFKQAIECTKSSNVKDLNYAKSFFDDVHAILINPSNDIIEIQADEASKNTLAYQCHQVLSKKAKEMINTNIPTSLDKIKEHMDAAHELFEMFKERYQVALKQSISDVKEIIKNQKS